MLKKIALGMFACLLFCISSTAIAESHDIAKIGKDAVIEEGTTAGDVAVVFANLTVNGTVEGDVAVVGGDLTVGPNGKILGDTAVVFGEIMKVEGSEIGKSVVEIPFGKKIKTFSFAFPILGLFALGMFALIALASIVIVVLLIAHLFTHRVGSASFYVQTYPWKSFFYGLLAFFFITPSILLLLVSVIGIPLIPLFIILIIIISFFGYAVMCQIVGLKFFHAIKKPNQNILWEVLVGFIILSLIIMIPYIGWFIKTIAIMTGVGATLATKFGKNW